MSDGPPVFSIASTATRYQDSGSVGISLNLSGQTFAKAFASADAPGAEEPRVNPALSMLSAMIGVQLAHRTAWLGVSASTSLEKLSRLFSLARRSQQPS